MAANNPPSFIARAAVNTLAFVQNAPVAAGNTTLTFLSYVVANLWTLLPAAIASLVIATAMSATHVPDGCREQRAQSINWFLCTLGSNPLNGLLDPAQAKVQTTPGKLPPGVTADIQLAGVKDKPDASKSKSDTEMAAREATARVAWSTAFVTLVLASIVGSLASVLLIGQGILGHRQAMIVEDPSADASAGWLYIFQFALLSLVILGVALGAALELISSLLGTGLGFSAIASAFASRAPIFKDAIMIWLDNHVDNLRHLMGIGGHLLLGCVLLLTMLVSSTLYQSPRDAGFRANATAAGPQGASYLRYLGRSFRRLKLAIYLGAALLVTLLAEITTQYNWALSYLADDASTPISKALTGFSQEVTTAIGFGFTLTLAALYFPAIVLIRERARSYYRARHPADSLQQQDAFLSDQGLVVTLPTSYSDFLALLAPLATASATHLFSVLGH